MQVRPAFFYLLAMYCIGYILCPFQSHGVEIRVVEWIGQEQVSSANLREVKRVLDYALEYYKIALEGTQTIRIRIIFEPLAAADLAWARYIPWPDNSTDQWWPSPLLIQVRDADVLQPTEPHAIVSINSTTINNGEFDFSLTPTLPVNKNGFLSTILHEFGHGLGFVSLVRHDGIWFDYGGNLRVDRHTANLCLFEEYPFFTPLSSLTSSAIASALMSDNLWWSGAHVSAAGRFLPRGGPIHYLTCYSKVYAPYSIPPLLSANNASHWDSSHTNPRQLMAPSNLGNLNKLGLLLPAFVDMGWTANFVTILPPAVPIEPSSSKAETLNR